MDEILLAPTQTDVGQGLTQKHIAISRIMSTNLRRNLDHARRETGCPARRRQNNVYRARVAMDVADRETHEKLDFRQGLRPMS